MCRDSGKGEVVDAREVWVRATCMISSHARSDQISFGITEVTEGNARNTLIEIKIKRITTAAHLFVRYMFILEYNQDENFNADVYMTPDFFAVCVTSPNTTEKKVME